MNFFEKLALSNIRDFGSFDLYGGYGVIGGQAAGPCDGHRKRIREAILNSGVEDAEAEAEDLVDDLDFVPDLVIVDSGLRPESQHVVLRVVFIEVENTSPISEAKWHKMSRAVGAFDATQNFSLDVFVCDRYGFNIRRLTDCLVFPPACLDAL